MPRRPQSVRDQTKCLSVNSDILVSEAVSAAKERANDEASGILGGY